MAPVGVARVEAVWAEGPCRNMTAGAGFPILLVPNQKFAEELRTKLLKPDGNVGIPTTITDGVSSREWTRSFVQQVGFTVHAALCSEDETVMPQLLKFCNVAADELRLPRLAELLVSAVNHLDAAMERKEMEEIDKMLDAEEAEQAEKAGQEQARSVGTHAAAFPVDATGENVELVHQGERGAVHGAEQRTDVVAGVVDGGGDYVLKTFAYPEKPHAAYNKQGVKGVPASFPPGKGPRRAHAAATVEDLLGCNSVKVFAVVFLTSVLPHYFCNVRPGLLISFFYFNRAKTAHPFSIFICSLCMLLFDMMVIPFKVFGEPLRKRMGDKAYARMRADAEQSVFTERMYKSVSFHFFTFLLLLLRQPLMDLMLTAIVYEPQSTSAWLLSLAWMYTCVKTNCVDYVKADADSLWILVSFSLFPVGSVFMYYCFAEDYGKYYYTGDKGMPTPGEMLTQLTYWGVSALVGILSGNQLYERYGGGVGGAKDDYVHKTKGVKGA